MFFKNIIVGVGVAVSGMAVSAQVAPVSVSPAPAAASASTAVWTLNAGLPVHEQLAGWAAQAGWQLSWQPRVSWRVAAQSEFEGSFEDAIGQVVQGLFFEGKPVRLVMWEGNKVAEVVSHDIR